MATVEELIIKLKLESRGIVKKINSYKNAINKSGKASKALQGQLKKLSTVQSNLARLTKINQKQFAGWALSIMFFGMQITRIFKSILNAGVKTFQDVMHSVEGTVTPFDMLKSSLDSIKFALGDAISNYIEPLLPTIFNLTSGLLDWVQQNEEAAAKTTLWGLAIGALMTAFGVLKLGMDGVLSALVKLGSLFTFIKVKIVTMSSALTTAGSSLGAFVAIITGIIILIVALFKTNFGNIKSFFVDTFGVLLETIKSIFKGIKDVLSTVWKAILAVFTGEWDKALLYLIKAVVQVVSLILKVFAGLGAGIVNAILFAFNLLVDIIKSAVNGVLSLLKLVATQMDRVLGTNMASGLQMAIDSVSGFAQRIQLEYISGEQISRNFDGIDQVLGLGQDGKTTNIVNNYDTGRAVMDDIEQIANVQTS